MEKLSKKHEHYLKISSSNNLLSILNAEENANNLLIQSVKSKLSLLNN